MESKTVFIEKQINIETNFGEIKISSPKKIQKLLTNIPYVDNSEIFGREKDILKIKKFLDKDKRVVLVNGLGGIGKTTVAKVFLNKYSSSYKHIVWINLSDNPKQSFILNQQLIESLYLTSIFDKIAKERILDDGFELIINKLRSIKSKCLLILDNATTSLYNSRILDHISLGENWNIIITSRITFEKLFNYELDVLDTQNALRLFYHHYKLEKNNKLIIQLLQEIGFHTLTIEVLSKIAQKKDYPLKNLFITSKKKG